MKRIISIAMLVALMVIEMSVGVFAESVTRASAESKAIKNANLTKKYVKILKSKYDREDREYEIEFTSKKNGAKYSYEIGANNGRIYEKSIDYKYKKNYSGKKISKTEAMKKASKASGVKLSVVKKGRCIYEYDDGEGIYEVKFRNGKYNYDIEIQAPTGKIIEYSWEYTGR